jgi:hypothetical protein
MGRGARWLAPLLLVLLAACASPAGAPDIAPTAVDPPSATATPAGRPRSRPHRHRRRPLHRHATATTMLRLRPATPGASITISAVGDISLARQVVDQMEANGGTTRSRSSRRSCGATSAWRT